MAQPIISLRQLAAVFLRTGAHSFGGWSTTALLLEKELAEHRHYLTKNQVHSAVTYAQVLPGATQIAIVSNVGYRLRGARGALLATGCYLLPAMGLFTSFGFIYFHYAKGSALTDHMQGLIAALGGVILANAYHIGKRHVTHGLLWAVVAAAFAAKLWLGVNAVIIILALGAAGLAWSWLIAPRQAV